MGCGGLWAVGRPRWLPDLQLAVWMSWWKRDDEHPPLLVSAVMMRVADRAVPARYGPRVFPTLSDGARRSGRKGMKGERRREAVVDGTSYKSVGSALVMAEMGVKFLQFAAQFPAIATDVLTRIGELLRVRSPCPSRLILPLGFVSIRFSFCFGFVFVFFVSFFLLCCSCVRALRCPWIP